MVHQGIITRISLKKAVLHSVFTLENCHWKKSFKSTVAYNLWYFLKNICHILSLSDFFL